MSLTDKEYVERCRDGHPDDFRGLVDRYQKPLFSFLAGRIQSPSQAEEAAQESFVRAFLSLNKLRKPESFYSWLLGIAGRVAQEQFRAWKRDERNQEIAETLIAGADRAEDYPLEEAIAVLPESYRQVILLRYYEGLSCQEIATRLEMPLGTVTKTLSRAYALLRQKLESREKRESASGSLPERGQTTVRPASNAGTNRMPQSRGVLCSDPSNRVIVRSDPERERTINQASRHELR